VKLKYKKKKTKEKYQNQHKQQLLTIIIIITNFRLVINILEIKNSISHNIHILNYEKKKKLFFIHKYNYQGSQLENVE